MQDVSAATSFELVSPSFSAYFAGDDIAQTAARVRHEVLAGDGAYPESPTQLSRCDDFEFAALQPDPYLPSLLSSFPIFMSRVRPEEDPVSVIENRVVVADDKLEPIRISFGKLLVDDGDLPSSSEEEEEELEGVPRGAFCMWSPRRPAPSGCRKSNSTGSSSGNPKRWRLTDLILRRSKSDGKRLASAALTVFPNSTYPATKKSEDKKKLPSPPPHELLYGRNGMKKEGERRRTYLPYRKDLVGIFGNGHGLGRNNARS